jgi:L-rhamnose isomerase
MDLLKVIQELRQDRARLDQAIESLEALVAAGRTAVPVRPATGRRGRKKGMSQEERQIVSQRMRDYWERRRREKAKSAGGGE